MGPLETNCYVLVEGEEAVAIDPGGKADSVLRFLEQNALKLVAVCNTHLHFDHILGNAQLAEKSGAAIYANPGDDYLLGSEFSGQRFGMPDTQPFTYQPWGEAEVTLLGLACQILHTPGHTPGSLSYYFPGQAALFCGDLLFHRSVGRTDLPGGDADALRNSVRGKIFPLPEQTVVYPGHGPATTVGEEKRLNPYVGGL
ncbi:MBL fold hydrolase [Deltaproteobacteria bacterium]|nr:MBL fold hydrolase [Deltaproteobacteria bacterium]